MNKEKLYRRIEALLHHPPARSITSGRDNEAEIQALTHLKAAIGRETKHYESEAIAADRVAAGANEYLFEDQDHAGREKGYVIDWRNDPRLRHPLSGLEKRIENVEFPTDENLIGSVDKVLTEKREQLVEKYGDLYTEDALEELALYIWRLLPTELTHNASPGKHWSILPADTRIPDHSVWEHLSLTSGLATADLGPQRDDWAVDQPSNASLFLLSVGPVQSFIGASRKTKDLQAGSFIVAYLTFQAIKYVCNTLGPEAILFPDLRKQPLADAWLQSKYPSWEIPDMVATDAATTPNRFFAVVPTERIDEIANACKAAITDEFRRLGVDVLDKLEEKLKGSSFEIDRDYQLSLVKEFIEVYWVSLPLHRLRYDDTTSFVQAFKATYGRFMDYNVANRNDILEAFSGKNKYPNVGATYGRLYRLCEAFSGSRKSLRDFTGSRQSGYRCNLISSLPALTVAGDTPSPGDHNKFWAYVCKRLPNNILAEGERLSVVALIKRFLAKLDPPQGEKDLVSFPDGKFPSTSSFATADFKEDLIRLINNGDQQLAGLLTNFLKTFKAIDQRNEEKRSLKQHSEVPIPYLEKLADENSACQELAALEGKWLYKESYENPSQLKKEYNIDSVSELSSVKKALQRLIVGAREKGISDPSRYYAVIQMDGDNMGKWLSGQEGPVFSDVLHGAYLDYLNGLNNPTWNKLIDKNNSYKRPLTPALHLSISRALGNFSLQFVDPIAHEQYKAKLVYSGGDDVLAFASIKDALPLARKLRAAYSGQLTPFPDSEGQWEVNWEMRDGFLEANNEILLCMGPSATASTGIVIAHHKTSLQTVVHEAHEACETHAKDGMGRNALVIDILKRSGEHFWTGTPWFIKQGEQIHDLVDALLSYSELVEKGMVSHGYVYTLAQIADSLEVFESRLSNQEWTPRNLEAIRAEALRLFRRQSEGLRHVVDLPDWIIPEDESASTESLDLQKYAFDKTVGLLLMANPVSRVASLLDGSQFIGSGGKE